ncbi:MAG: IS256 family transposase [bacterium]
MLEEDVTTIAGPKGKHDPGRAAYRHTRETSSVGLGGRRVAVDKPRVRSVAGEEIALPTWNAFDGDELLSEMALERMLAGLSTRHYPAGLEPVGDDLDPSGIKRSSVSRRFVNRTKVALQELMGKDLSELNIVAIFADGVEVAEHTMVTALGVDNQGYKHVLGLRQGSTENKTVCRDLFSDLEERGLDFSGGILLVLDGGKGLKAGAKAVFGEFGLIHRCRIHKRRNVLDYLPKSEQPFIGRKLDQAWRKDDPDEALRALQALARSLDDRHPDAAASLREGMEETLTVTRLGLPPSLLRTFQSTNTVESAFSVARTTMRNVKRWRDGKMIQRWTAAGLEVAQKQFRRVNGYRDMRILVAALRAHAEKVSQEGRKVA